MKNQGKATHCQSKSDQNKLEDVMARKATDLVNLTLRLPEALRQQLASKAENANRSLNSQILWRLGQTFSDQWRGFVAGVEEQQRREEEELERIMQSPKMWATLKIVVADLYHHKKDTKKT